MNIIGVDDKKAIIITLEKMLKKNRPRRSASVLYQSS